MNLTDFLSGPVANALGWTLLHALWQGFALVLPTAVILYLLRNRSSELRYRVGVLALLAQLVLSITTFAWCYEPAVDIVNAVNDPIMRQTLSMRWQALTHTLEHQPLPWYQQVQQFLQLHLSQFVFIYLIGVALFGIRLAGGWVYLQRLSQTASQPVNQQWAGMTNMLRSAMAIRAVVRVRESARIVVPMVVGVFKPVLLLPLGLATHLSIREVEAVLAHELAHIKRHDYAVNLLQSLVEVLYFFHPALWWLSERVREEREHCCDDLAVLAIGGDGRIMAQALVRVEEIRLTQTAPTPALAMAIASQRHQLLHRVHRMLGVPTRPFVSNSSLAGLTLATVLLVSASVYAVQKQDKPQPKPRTTKSKSTRKHTTGNGTEFSISDNQKVDYVIWKGQKLPATRVARLQRQLDQVMTGQLSLDRVKQPDRDILLTIIETNNSFGDGMDGLTAGLSHLDYNTIIKTGFDAANAAGTFPVDVDNVLKEVEKVDYNTLIGDAMASVGQLNSAPDSLDPKQAYHQRQMDSLSRLMEQQTRQMQALRLQMEKFRFPIEEIDRNSETLQWRKDKLMEQRDALIEKHQRLLHTDPKQKLSQAEVEKQLAALEPEIKKLEGSMEKLNKQVEATNARLETARQPLEKLEKEAEQLEEQIDRLANEINKHSEHLAGAGFMSRDHKFNLRLNENLNIHLNENLNIQKRQLDRQARDMRLHMNRLEPLRETNLLAPPRQPRVPRPPKEPTPPRLRGLVAPPAPPVAPVRPNVRVVTPPTLPRPAQKPAPAPVPRPADNP